MKYLVVLIMLLGLKLWAFDPQIKIETEGIQDSICPGTCFLMKVTIFNFSEEIKNFEYNNKNIEVLSKTPWTNDQGSQVATFKIKLFENIKDIAYFYLDKINDKKVNRVLIAFDNVNYNQKIEVQKNANEFISVRKVR